MKLAFTTATLAAGALAVAMSVSPASAAASMGHQKWCVKNIHQTGNQLNASCRYSTLAACNKAATPTSGKCFVNPKWASIHKKSTTGMKADEK